jgi:hypothetical protein
LGGSKKKASALLKKRVSPRIRRYATTLGGDLFSLDQRFSRVSDGVGRHTEFIKQPFG